MKSVVHALVNLITDNNIVDDIAEIKAHIDGLQRVIDLCGRLGVVLGREVTSENLAGIRNEMAILSAFTFCILRTRLLWPSLIQEVESRGRSETTSLLALRMRCMLRACCATSAF
jgi:hypothetical protein